jgi:hypothetical protein
MSADDLTDQAAKTLLGGKGRIEARAAGYTPAEAARRWYDDDALEAVEAALEDDRVAVTDDLLANLREDAELDDATAAAVTGDDVDADADGSGGSGVSAEILTASDYVNRRNKRRERVEASRESQTAGGTDPDDVALAAMDGDDRVEAKRRGQDPAAYIRAEYGLDPADFDGGDVLNAAIMDQSGDGED